MVWMIPTLIVAFACETHNGNESIVGENGIEYFIWKEKREKLTVFGPREEDAESGAESNNDPETRIRLDASGILSFRANVLFRQYCWSYGELLSCIDVLAALVNDSSEGSSWMESPVMGTLWTADVGFTRMVRPSNGSNRNNSESLLFDTVEFDPFDRRKSKSDDWKTTSEEKK